MNNLKEQFQSMKLTQLQKDQIVRNVEANVQQKKNTKQYSYVKFVLPAFVVIAAFYLFLLFMPTQYNTLQSDVTASFAQVQQSITAIPKRALLIYVFTIITYITASYYLFLSIHSVKRWENRYIVNEIRVKCSAPIFALVMLIVMALYGVGALLFIETHYYREIAFIAVILYYFWATATYRSRSTSWICCKACGARLKPYQFMKSGEKFTCKGCGKKDKWDVQERTGTIFILIIPVAAYGIYNLFHLHSSSFILLLLLLVGLGYFYMLPFTAVDRDSLKKFHDPHRASLLQAIISCYMAITSVVLFFLLRGPDVDLPLSIFSYILLSCIGLTFAILSIVKRKWSPIAYVGILLNIVVIIFALLLLLAYSIAH